MTIALMGLAAACSPLEERPYVVDLDDALAPAWGVADLEEAAQEAFDAALSFHAAPVFDGYDIATAGRDLYCPYWTEEGEANYWYGDCTAESGTRFSGYGGYESAVVGAEWARSMYASATIEVGDGSVFGGGGNAYLSGGVNAEGDEYGYSSVSGNFAWDGAGAEGSWLRDGVDLSLLLYWVDAEWGRAVQMHGAVVRPAGTTVRFENVVLIDTVCPGEPSGTVSIRGEDGWYDVLFDLVLDEPMDEAKCDGCGEAWYRGERIGEVCVDADALPQFSGGAF